MCVRAKAKKRFACSFGVSSERGVETIVCTVRLMQSDGPLGCLQYEGDVA